MNTTDLITLLGNLSQSLYPVQRLITGGAYLLGILFFIKAISVLKKIGDHRTQSHSQEKMYTPMMYGLFGSALIFLPTIISTMANTAFGVGNILTYSNYNSKSIYNVMDLLVRTAGVIWFIRGCVLIAHSSEPSGAKEGMKGLIFLISGILAINFDNTIAMINSIINSLLRMTISIKSSQGF